MSARCPTRCRRSGAIFKAIESPISDGDAPYQGCAESWYDSIDDVIAMRNSGAYPKMLADERNFIDPGSAEFLLTQDRVIVEGERKPGMVKCVVLVKRKPEMTVADFNQYWLEVHAPPVAKFAPIRRYVQSPTVSPRLRGRGTALGRMRPHLVRRSGVGPARGKLRRIRG